MNFRLAVLLRAASVFSTRTLLGNVPRQVDTGIVRANNPVMRYAGLVLALLVGQLAGAMPPPVEAAGDKVLDCCCCGNGQPCTCPCSRSGSPSDPASQREALLCTCDVSAPALPAAPVAGADKPQVSNVQVYVAAHDVSNQTRFRLVHLRNHDPPGGPDPGCLSILLI